MFEEDSVKLIKLSGKIVEGIRANVQPNIIFIKDTNLPIEEDDIIERKLKNGLIERYLVLDRGYYHSGYQCKVKKENTVKKQNSQNTIIYNLNGYNSKVNIQSTDSSITIVKSDSNEIFDKLINVIDSNVENSKANSSLKCEK